MGKNKKNDDDKGIRAERRRMKFLVIAAAALTGISLDVWDNVFFCYFM